MDNISPCENDLYIYKYERKESASVHDIKSISTKLIKNGEDKDLINFFTNPKGIDMLPYAFMPKKDSYNQLISQSKTYYLFQDEVATIKKSTNSLPKYFNEVTRFIEIGPGSSLSLENKTIPILKCAPKANLYYAIDLSTSYLQKTYNFIKNSFSNLIIKTFELDFLRLNKFTEKNYNGKTCVLFLGGTLGNFKNNQQQKILDNICSIMNKNDLFIITADLNNDVKSLKEAYNSSLAHNLIKNGLDHFLSSHKSIEFNIEDFDVKYKWNSKGQYINLYFQANKNFKISLRNMCIKKGQKFYGVKSRKFTQEIINAKLEKSGFKIVDQFQNTNKMLMILCEKQ